ncbi:MAG: Serine/threonine-protein kinase AfsK [bacterium ADurb.Bin429]|nr:MAG: Serine/threonine-protein kinase AfsK [bacterium ADurb.Bin429]
MSYNVSCAILILLLASALLPAYAVENAAAPAMYYSQWGTPICDDTATNKTQPLIAISGLVYSDQNGDGRRDDGEPGLPDICVSNGEQVVKTGPDGAYTLAAVQPGVHRAIFVTVPSGYRIGGRFYQLIPAKCDGMTADIGLVPDHDSLNPNYAFAHVTDTHITRKGVPAFEEMKALPIAFIVVTGDMTNNRELDAFQDAASRSPFPVMALPGNHDVLVNGSGALAPALGTDAGYETILGPKYYSFDYAGRHYVFLNSVEDMPRQMVWLKNDLGLQPEGMELLIFQHFPPTTAQMALYKTYHARAVFSGHTHANRVFRDGETLYVNTPPFFGGGLDFSPRTFRVVSLKGNQISLESYASGFGQHSLAETGPSPAESPARMTAVRLRRDWPMFKGDPARAGVARDAVTPPFIVAWRQPLGLTIHMASPVIGNGLVYIGAGDDTRAERSGVYALDAKTGAVRWHYPTLAKVAHSVTLAKDTVLATSNDGMLYAINAKTGEKRWSYALGNPHDCWLYTAPVVAGKLVICGTAQHFTALELATGKPRWRMPSESAGHWPTYSSPAVLGDTVFGAFPGSGAFACDARTGERHWRADKSIVISSNGAPTLAVSENTVFVRTNSTLFALDAATGTERWRYANKGGASSPVTTGPAVFLGIGNGAIVKLDADTGKELWTYTPPAAQRPAGRPRPLFDARLIATPIISGDIIYACTTDGLLLAINAETGAERAVTALNAPVTASLAISGNTIFLASYTGTVYALVSTAE